MSDSNQPHIILFCPVRECPEILEVTLESHRELEGIAERWYFDDNEDPASSELLQGLNRIEIPNLPPREGYQGHGWTPSSMGRMAAIRDYALHHFGEKWTTDAVFMIDADIVPHPQTAVRLADPYESDTGDALVVSEIFWSQWPSSPLWLPNVWDADNYSFHSLDNIVRLRDPGNYPVGGLGACTLIDWYAVEQGASYLPLSNLTVFPGEDRHFCIRNAALGIDMQVNTELPAFHIYRKEQLAEAKKWKKSGCPPCYFRENWLTDEWANQVRGMK
jgi:hypothetical protein